MIASGTFATDVAVQYALLRAKQGFPMLIIRSSSISRKRQEGAEVVNKDTQASLTTILTLRLNTTFKL